MTNSITYASDNNSTRSTTSVDRSDDFTTTYPYGETACCVRSIAPEKIVESMAAQNGEVVAPHGAAAANALGLTQQVPIREVYLTSGRTRKLKLGRSEVLVKHAPRWMLALGKTQASAAVRALAWMGPTHAGESLATLRRTLPPLEWQTLTASRAALPS